MNYEVLFKCAPVIQINGDLVIPPTYKGDTNFIIPDQIVLFCMDQYDLTKQDVRVLDPMCGIGTIPRVINRHGGNCMGIELDEYRFKVALTVSDHKKLKQEDMLRVDCLTKHSFHCIFTSMPFDWFKQENSGVTPDFANQFKNLLTSDGFVLLDSVPQVNRMGETWSVAAHQCDYLEKNGFLLVAILRFNSNTETGPTESVIMKFQLTNNGH